MIDFIHIAEISRRHYSTAWNNVNGYIFTSKKKRKRVLRW